MTAPRVKAQVLIITTQGNIQGELHYPPGGRISDFLNIDKDFLAITNAKITLSNGQTHSAEVFMVNRTSISLVIPIENLK